MSEIEGFRPWGSLRADELKDEYDRAVSQFHAFLMRANMLAISLSAADAVAIEADRIVKKGQGDTALWDALDEWRSIQP